MTPEELVDFSETLARVAAAGGGAKALAAQLALAAGGCVLLEDAQWRQLATAGTGTIPPSARPIVEAAEPGLAVRVTAAGTDLGWLSVHGAGCRSEAGTLLRLAAAAIGVELARDGYALRGRKTGFWESLLGRAFGDAVSAREEAAARSIALAPSYLAVALELESGDAPAGAGSQLRTLAADVFGRADADIGLIERGAALLVFVPAPRTVDASNVRTAATLLPKNLARRRPQLRISGGVGTVETPLALPAGAQRAQAALAIGRRIYGPGRVAIYDELGAYRLLYEGADVDRLRAFAKETLTPLRAYDEKHQTELERTLRLYFNAGQNVKTAAAQLHVHRHTVFYRLRQIAEISGCSLENPQDQLTLRLALATDELHDAL